MSRRTVLSLVAVVCGLAAMAGAALRLTTDESTTIEDRALVQASSPIVAINTPTLKRNPTNGDNIALTYRVNYDYFSAFLEWSDNGGRTFNQTELPTPAGTAACSATQAGRPCPFAADLAYAPDGTLYVVYVNLEGRGNVPQNLWLSRSTDGGRTLGPPTRVAGRLTFQPRIAIAPDGTIHLTWLQAPEVGTLSIVGTAPIMTVRSADGGQSFSDAIAISDTRRERVGVASPVIAANGAITVMYQDFKGDRRDFENLDGPVYEEPFALVITRSTDGGITWTPGLELEAGVIPADRFLVFLPEFPSVAAGPGDNLYAAWTDARNGDRDVFVKRSADGGLTWTAAVRVNESPLRDGTDQFLPKIEVNGSGTVFVLYYDRSSDPDNHLAEAVLSTSTDSGSTWEHLTVSSAPVDGRVGPPPVDPKLGIDLGSRLGLHVSGNTAYLAWADTRESNEAFGSQDISVGRVQLGEDVHLLGQVPVVIGLFLLGGIALAVLQLRPGTSPPGTGTAGTAPPPPAATTPPATSTAKSRTGRTSRSTEGGRT